MVDRSAVDRVRLRRSAKSSPAGTKHRSGEVVRRLKSGGGRAERIGAMSMARAVITTEPTRRNGSRRRRESMEWIKLSSIDSAGDTALTTNTITTAQSRQQPSVWVSSMVRRPYIQAISVYLAVRLVGVVVLAAMAAYRDQSLLDRLTVWDAQWYIKLADLGYQGIMDSVDAAGHPYADMPMAFSRYIPASRPLCRGSLQSALWRPR